MKLLSIGDLHTGSSVALAKDHEIDTLTDKPVLEKANPAQAALAAWYDELVKRVKFEARKHEIVSEFGGDMIDGERQHDTFQTWGSDIDQANHAIELIRPLVNLSSNCHFLRGTSAHAGNVGEWDNYIAREFGYTAKFHIRAKIGRGLFDFAHHCSLPKDKRNQEAALERQASQICRAYRDAGEPIPDVIVRHHVHRHAHAWHGMTQMVTNYGWKLRDDYLAKIDPLGLYTVGALLIDCETLEIEAIGYDGKEDEITTHRTDKRKVK